MKFEQTRGLLVALFLVFLPTVFFSQTSADSLIAYWKFNEDQDTLAADETGNHDGTLENGANFRPQGGHRRGAVEILNTSDRVSVPPFDIVGDELTISAWIYVNRMENSDKSDEGRIISKASGTARSSHYWMLSLNDGGKLRVRIKTGGSNFEMSSPSGMITTGRWTFVAVSYDGSEVRMYIDSQVVRTASLSGTLATDPTIGVGIGNQPDDASGIRPFVGLIDDLKVFNKGLTGAQIVGQVSNRSRRSHWPLDELGGSTAFDREGDFDGTLNTGVVFRPNRGYTDGAAEFDGDTGRIALPNIDLIGEEMTIMAWINPGDISTTHNRDEARIMSKSTGVAPEDHIWMLSLNEGGRLRGRLSTAGDFTELETETGVIVTNTWTHVAMTYDGTELVLYVDGQPLASTLHSGDIRVDPSVQVAIGNQPEGAGDRPFDGFIDEVYLYERGLSQAEIQQTTVQGSALPVVWRSFGADARKGRVVLNWEVADQRDNAGFYVERAGGESADFRDIGFVPAHSPDRYQFTDDTAPAGTLLYRLRQLDHDGSHDHSRVVSVSMTSATDLSVYPNPAAEGLRVTQSGPYRIYSATGRIVQEGNYREGEVLSLHQLPRRATYHLRVNGEVTSFYRR
jgi:hypothetical protein